MPVLSKAPRGNTIRRINDACRRSFTGCMIVTTEAVADLPDDVKAIVLNKVRTFTRFDADNDPHHEHDMAFFDHDSERYFFTFDYYAPDMEHGSDDPSDTDKTRRVVTIGMASDY